MKLGEGVYIWRGTDKVIHTADHWDDIPEEIDFLVRFQPSFPEPPHTQADHDYMATFSPKMMEIMRRCRL